MTSLIPGLLLILSCHWKERVTLLSCCNVGRVGRRAGVQGFVKRCEKLPFNTPAPHLKVLAVVSLLQASWEAPGQGWVPATCREAPESGIEWVSPVTGSKSEPALEGLSLLLSFSFSHSALQVNEPTIIESFNWGRGQRASHCTNIWNSQQHTIQSYRLPMEDSSARAILQGWEENQRNLRAAGFMFMQISILIIIVWVKMYGWATLFHFFF